MNEVSTAPNAKLQRSVESLKAIYAVIIGLACKEALQVTMEGSTWNEIVIHANKGIPILISFFILIIPFSHGMNRYLDLHYYEKNEFQKITFLFDFIIFLAESSLFYVAASLIKYGEKSFVVLSIILLVDVFWAIISFIIYRKTTNNKVPSWAIINSVTLIPVFFILKFNLFGEYIFWILCSLFTIRTFVDYYVMKDFYFPD